MHSVKSPAVNKTIPIKVLEYYITLSAEPVATMNSLKGLNDKQLTSAVWASTAWLALEVLFERVSQLKGQDTG